MGFTPNQITMLALTFGGGHRDDDAVVVLENIFRFIEEKGVPPYQAAIDGTKEWDGGDRDDAFLLAGFLPVGLGMGIVWRFMFVWAYLVVCDCGLVTRVVHADTDPGGAHD